MTDLTVAIISLVLVTTMRREGFPDHSLQLLSNPHMALRPPVFALISYPSPNPELRYFS